MVTVVGKTSSTVDGLFSTLLSDVVVAVEIIDGKLYSTDKTGAVTYVGDITASPGSGGTFTITKEFNFASPLATWTCTHNFNKTKVDVTAFDNNGDQVYGDVEYVNENVVQVKWWSPLAGGAIVQR